MLIMKNVSNLTYNMFPPDFSYKEWVGELHTRIFHIVQER